MLFLRRIHIACRFHAVQQGLPSVCFQWVCGMPFLQTCWEVKITINLKFTIEDVLNGLDSTIGE